MPYQPNSTFVTFPNGEAQDVAGCGFTVTGTTLMLTRAGQTLYSYKFSSDSAVRSFIGTVMAAMLAFNTNPLFSYAWSTDAMTWNPGPIPITKQPLYLQIGTEITTNFSSATIKDYSGREFPLTLDVVAQNLIVVGPFNSPGGNTPAVGIATLTVFDNGGAIVGSLVIDFVAQASNMPSVSLVQWSVDDIHYTDLPVNITPGSPFSFQINGSNLPLGTEYAAINGVQFLQTSVSSTQITTGNFSLGLPAGTYDLQLQDISSNILADFGMIISVISS